MARRPFPRVTAAIIGRHGGVVVVDGRGYTTQHGRVLRTRSVEHLIRAGRLINSGDGLVAECPQTYHLLIGGRHA